MKYKKMVNKIRSKVELNETIERITNRFLTNWFYRRLIYFIANKKANNFKKNKQLGFAIEVSSLCNARCFFCPNRFMKRPKGIMSDMVFDAIVRKIRTEGIKPTFFNLTGTGEPLIDKNLFTKIKILKKEFPNSYIFFPTNLSLANKSIIDQIVDSKLDLIVVSLNASDPVGYEKIMGLKYANTINNLNQLIKIRNKKRSKLKIQINVAANKDNADSLRSFIKKWDERVDDISINWIHSWGGVIEDESIRKNISIYRYPCKSLFNQVVIQSNGNIPLCCIDYEGSYVNGNVLKDSILASFYSRNMEKIRNKHLSGRVADIKMCRNCRFSEKGLDWLIK